nr:hypothetical protein [Tanacetum cinerariifolium]
FCGGEFGCGEFGGGEFGAEGGLDGMEEDDDEVPLVERSLRGAFGGDRELGLLVGLLVRLTSRLL